ncbi:metallophosphoesterase family protein [Corynebacterium sphenisci]|uniref:metallophosphoesterase family protein n=1 Tax=Corynebacterium sphenisci TaxID=191493 RepID=UPI0026DEF76E|nr:metallophosphoesterase [Corynebacterium sphenisci]MDO5730944.1 metallophosphoesterase [Corynebacterium sphenisci]
MAETERPRTLWAVADLHVSVPGNREVVAALAPDNPDDWLIVAGDVAERPELILRTLGELAARYARVIFTPGNHDLFCRGTDRHVGEDRYAQLIEGCRALGVLTPEDPYPQFGGVTVCPLFTLYDYSWRRPGTTVDEALAEAAERGVVFTDEMSIRPFADPVLWCRRRLAYTVRRLSRIAGPTVLINHWPLAPEPLAALRHPEMTPWCGTRHTRDWPRRYGARAVVYGHLHIPAVHDIDGVRHAEVSLGYPRQWRRRPPDHRWPYPVMEDR